MAAALALPKTTDLGEMVNREYRANLRIVREGLRMLRRGTPVAAMIELLGTAKWDWGDYCHQVDRPALGKVDSHCDIRLACLLFKKLLTILRGKGPMPKWSWRLRPWTGRASVIWDATSTGNGLMFIPQVTPIQPINVWVHNPPSWPIWGTTLFSAVVGGIAGVGANLLTEQIKNLLRFRKMRNILSRNYCETSNRLMLEGESLT